MKYKPPKKKVTTIFWIPIIIVLSIELLFRLGVWEPLLKPNSHASYSSASKNIQKVFENGVVNAITMGDSRARIGINHGKLTDYQKLKGINHLNMTLNRSHYVTFEAITDWASEHFSKLNPVVIAMSKTELKKNHYGPFELAKTQPFTPWYKLKKTNVFDEEGYKNGFIQILSNYSAFVTYRKDIRDLLSNPIKRFKDISETSVQQNVYQNIGSNKNTCKINLSTIKNCQNNTDNPLLNIGRQNVLKRYCTNEFALDVITNGKPFLTEENIEKAAKHWISYFNGLAEKNIKVVLVWLPDHPLIKEQLTYDNEYLLFEKINKFTENNDKVFTLDLSNLFEEQNLNYCNYFHELVHPNKKGTQLITQKVINFISSIQ